MLRTASAISSRDRGSGETRSTSTAGMLLRTSGPPGRSLRPRWGSATLRLRRPTSVAPRGGDVETNHARVAVAEFVATFTLIFIGAGAVVLNAAGNLDLTGVALAHGLALAIMVSITMHISGGLVNPAVAISLWVTGKLPSTRAVVLHRGRAPRRDRRRAPAEGADPPGALRRRQRRHPGARRHDGRRQGDPDRGHDDVLPRVRGLRHRGGRTRPVPRRPPGSRSAS